MPSDPRNQEFLKQQDELREKLRAEREPLIRLVEDFVREIHPEYQTGAARRMRINRLLDEIEAQLKQ